MENKKPQILIYKELEEDILRKINMSGLPIWVIKPIIERIYNQILALENQELENAKKEYDEGKEKEKNEKSS